MITKTEKDFIKIIIMLGIFINLLWFVGCAHVPTDYHIMLTKGDRIIIPSDDPTRNVVIEMISDREFRKECLNPNVEVLHISEISEDEYIDQWNRWGNE